MEKGWIISVVVLLGLFLLLVSTGFFEKEGKLTGYAVSGDYITEVDCVGASYVWEEILNETCTEIPDCVECVEGCESDCTSCVDEVIGGECTGDVCDSENLNLCLTLGECEVVEVGGYWYNNTCNAGACVENWVCDEWDACSNGEQTRVCTDSGGCEAEEKEELQTCVKESEEEDETSEETSETIEEEDEDDYDNTITQLTATDISSLTLNPNDTAQITWSVENTGTEYVSACKLKPLGDFSSWFLISDETQNLNVGTEKEFTFNIIIPEDSEEGSYLLSASVECSETTASKDFAIEVIKKKLDFIVIDAQRTRATRVRVIYSLEELSGNDQDVVFIFSLVGANSIEVGMVEVNQSIDANSSKEFRTNININESLLPINETTNEILESELILNVNFNSEIYSSSVQERITLGAPIAGFAIFGDGVGTAGSIIILIVIILGLGSAFLIVRRIRTKSKN